MADHTYYIRAANAVTPNYWGNLQDNGTPPTAANSAYGYKVAKTSTATPFWRSRLGATAVNTAEVAATSYIDATSGPTHGTGSGATTAGDSFVTPAPIIGVFPGTAWTFNWVMQASTAGAIGRIRMRVWKSVNADGSTPTELTTSTQVGSIVTLSTTAGVNSTISWSPGAITMSNEYLFFQIEWEETTAGSSTNSNVLFRAHDCLIITPTLIGIEYEDHGTYTSSSTTSVTLPFPTAILTGNLVLASVTALTTDSAGVCNTPTGWTPVIDVQATNGSPFYTHIYVFAAIYSAGLTGVFTRNSTNSSGIDGLILGFSGTGTTVGTAVGTTATTAGHNASTTIIPGPSGFTSGEWLAYFSVNLDNQTLSSSSPTLSNTFTTGGGNNGWSVGTLIPGSSPGNETITWTGGTDNYPGIGVTILPLSTATPVSFVPLRQYLRR